MGSSNSRMGGSGRPPLSRPNHRHPKLRRPGLKRNLSSLLICGASSSSSHDLRNEMEDDPAGLLVSSAEHSDVGKFQFSAKSSALSTDCRSEYLGPRVVHSLSSEKSIYPGGNYSREDAAQNSETKETVEILYKEKGLHSTAQSMDNLRTNETTSTSSHNELSPESLFADRKANVNGVNNGKGETSEIASGNYDDLKSTNDPSSDAEESCDEEMSHENPENEFMIFQDCDYTSGPCSGSAPSDSPLDSMVQTSSSGVGSSVADNEEDHRNGNELQIDMASVSSNILSNSFFGLTSHEARRSNRRLFWDSFSRRNFRRNANSRTFLFAADDTESLGFHDRSHLDFSGELFDYEVGGNTRSYHSSNQSTNEQRWRSSSEAWERSRNLDNGSDRRATLCPSGIHPDGTCSCSSILTAEESGARASISRIVMLAEALFEVLDEVHRQPSSLSLSMVSLPAAESVVDSLPVKNYSELERTEGRDDFTQCYICLSEYNEGDTIRILPCHHEFHASCVDKWLKEIHGVCPLCRGDVREGFSKGSVSV